MRAAPNVLLGRAADLGAIEDLVRGSRVTTVLGPGGTGKTRVANALGTRLAGEMPVVLVELASVRADPEDPEGARVEVEAAISAVLGVGESARDTKSLLPRRVDAARERLREALSARALLLILDNCEHLVAAVAEVVADLIGASERLTVLTTSRSPLEITAETVYPLPPLAIDDDGSPATELFATRARAVRPSIRLDPQAVARLCRTLDGLPLAIELAAARARTLSVEEIETRLSDRFALLRSGDRSSPARHRTLHAVIEWSWNLLDEPQRIALRRLCRFPAGFTSAAAEFVAFGDGVDDVAAAVDGLVGQSLLTVLEDETGGIRYRMLETVREFGEEQLLAAGEAEAVMRAMSVWARDFSVRAVDLFFSGRQVACVLTVTADSDNLVAVLRWASDRQDAVTFYTVLPVLGLIWAVRGAHMEIVNWAPRLLELEPPPAGPPPHADLQMLALVLTGGHMLTMGEEIRALARVRTWARRLLRSGAELDPLARFYGDVMCVRPDVVAFGRLLCAAERSPERGVAAAALLLRASIKENAGDYDGSLRDTLRGTEFQHEEDVWGGAMVAQNLGQLRGQAGDYAAAAHHYRRAVEKLVLLRAYDEAVEIRSYLAQALLGCGDLDGARRELDIAAGYLDQGHSPDDPSLEPSYRRAAVQAGWAELALAAGEVDTGLRRMRTMLPMLNWPGESRPRGPGELPSVCCVLGAHVLHGQEDQVPRLAAELVSAALERLQQFLDLPQLGAVACSIGSYLLSGDRDPVVGRELLALAPRVHGRQDVPSMLWDRHRAFHASPDLTAAVTAAATVSRRRSARRIMELLEVLDSKAS